MVAVSGSNLKLLGSRIKISSTNTQYMNFNFSGDAQIDVTPVRIEAQNTTESF